MPDPRRKERAVEGIDIRRDGAHAVEVVHRAVRHDQVVREPLPGDEFASGGGEGGEIRVSGADDGVVLLVGLRGESEEVRVGNGGGWGGQVFEEEVAEPGVGDFEGGWGGGAVGVGGGGGEGGEVGSGQDAVPEVGAVKVRGARPDFRNDGRGGGGYGVGLIVGGAVVGLADEGVGVDGAEAWAVEDAVLSAVEGVAVGDGESVDSVEFTLGRGVVFVPHYHLRPLLRRRKVIPVHSRSSRNDPIVIIRIHLRFHQTLSSTSRTALPVGILWRRSIEALRDSLADDRHVVHRATGKVQQEILIDIAWTD